MARRRQASRPGGGGGGGASPGALHFQAGCDMMRKPNNNPPSPFQTSRSSGWLPAFSPEAKQETERQRGQRRQRVLEVQAAHERLHAVCQEVQGGVHADAPWKGQQVGAVRCRTTTNSRQFTYSCRRQHKFSIRIFRPCRPDGGTAATFSTPEIQVTLGAYRSTLERVLLLMSVYFLP